MRDFSLCFGFKGVQAAGCLNVAAPNARVAGAKWFEFCSAHYACVEGPLSAYLALPVQPRAARCFLSAPNATGDFNRLCLAKALSCACLSPASYIINQHSLLPSSSTRPFSQNTFYIVPNREPHNPPTPPRFVRVLPV